MSDPSDRFELEAERSADRFTDGVAQREAMAGRTSAPAGTSVQRSSAEEHEEEAEGTAAQRLSLQRQEESEDEEEE